MDCLDSYFEWSRSGDGKKQPYFIYFPPLTSDDDKFEMKQEQKVEVKYSNTGNDLAVGQHREDVENVVKTDLFDREHETLKDTGTGKFGETYYVYI